MLDRIYLDYAAATPVDPDVTKVMLPYLTDRFGNPSSLHAEGQQAAEAIKQARAAIAHKINAQPQEIVFTGSGTESCNLAIFGAIKANLDRRHIVTTPIEHHAVLNAVRHLEAMGWKVSYAHVDENGRVLLDQLIELVNDDTCIVSVMMANNEVGTINPIKEIARRVKEKNPKTLVHTDAMQAMGYLPIDVKSLGIDLLSFNAAKIYGPKGVGALYVKKGVALEPVIYGGGQEKTWRSGTENVPAIIGFAKAMEMAVAMREGEAVRLAALRDQLIEGMGKQFPSAIINGHPTDRLPNNVNVSFPGMDGEAIVIYLNEEGIAASTSAACTTATSKPSHVLLGMGKSEDVAKSSVRFSLGRSTTGAEIDATLGALERVMKKL